jgi:peptidoglycan/LPS O-acetylase OafA/YrhL
LFSIALFLGSDITKPGTFGLSHVALWSYPLFLQNIMMSITNNWATGWVSPTWSLAIEEQFYLLLPIAIRYLSRRGIWCAVVAAIFCAPVIRMGILLSGGGNIGPRALLPCRADALGFGVLAALAIRDEFLWNWLNTHRRMMYAAFSVLGLGVLALLTTVSGGSFFFIAVGYSWLAAFYTVLLLLLVVKPGRAERIAFRSTPLVRLGIVSYAVYVFHVPVNSLWHRAVFGSAPSFDNWSSILVTLLSVSTTLLLAALSWRVLEKPLIRRAHAKFRYETAQA